MGSADQFGSLLPIWGCHPALVALFIFGIDFGAVLLLKVVFERKLTNWLSFWIGDTVGLPLFAGFAAVIMRNHEPSAVFYTETWCHLLLLALGVVTSFGVNGWDIRSGLSSSGEQFSPSKFYHTVIFGVVFYWMGTALMVASHRPSPHWAAAFALSGLALYLVTIVIDQVRTRPRMIRERKKLRW